MFAIYNTRAEKYMRLSHVNHAVSFLIETEGREEMFLTNRRARAEQLVHDYQDSHLLEIQYVEVSPVPFPEFS